MKIMRSCQRTGLSTPDPYVRVRSGCSPGRRAQSLGNENPIPLLPWIGLLAPEDKPEWHARTWCDTPPCVANGSATRGDRRELLVRHLTLGPCRIGWAHYCTCASSTTRSPGYAGQDEWNESRRRRINQKTKIRTGLRALAEIDDKQVQSYRLLGGYRCPSSAAI